MKFAEIAFLQKKGIDSNLLTYSLNTGLAGQSVTVSLRGKKTNGLIWRIHSEKPSFKTLSVEEINDTLLLPDQIKLIDWMSQYYFCPLHKILKLFIPKRVFDNKPIKRLPKEKPAPEKGQIKELTDDQKNAIDSIISSPLNNFLIHGITGSGKTEIYVKLAEHFIQNNQQVLILVPEISLTPQTIEYFEKALGIRAAVIHSKLAEGERYKAWNDIRTNKTKLVIGSRSAIFSPFQDLGLTIIDEEHELSYKQDQAPRYTIHKVAEKMQELSPKLKIVLGSATPSIESAEKLKDSTITITQRIGDSELPKVEIVDLRDEFKKRNHSIFSDTLKAAITEAIAKKEQTILFLNRRGSASSVVCRDCGYSETCESCDMAMTYHASTLSQPKLICHHCGKIKQEPITCPKCKGANIRHLGIGTQKIESELKKEFPNIRVLRADKDTTSAKLGFQKIYESFRNHEADVLVGTQMIAKGLHLPKVNLVGIILADIGLNIPDFRTAERNFQLMTQVAGRAGRSGTEGKVIIQTYNPEHITLLCAKKHDYEKFFNYERRQRSILKNPPFSKLAKILIENKSAKEALQLTQTLEDLLWKIAREHDFATELEINSYPAFITRFKGKYRHIILIKSTAEQPQIHNLLEKLPKEYIMQQDIKIDIDPVSVT